MSRPADGAEPAGRVLRGLAVSPGLVCGPVVVLDQSGLLLLPRAIEPGAVAAE